MLRKARHTCHQIFPCCKGKSEAICFLKVYFYFYLRGCVKCVRVPEEASKGHWVARNWSSATARHPEYILGKKPLRSSRRAASALSLWALSLGPINCHRVVLPWQDTWFILSKVLDACLANIWSVSVSWVLPEKQRGTGSQGVILAKTFSPLTSPAHSGSV